MAVTASRDSQKGICRPPRSNEMKDTVYGHCERSEAIYIIFIDSGIASSSRKAGLLAMILVFGVISDPTDP